MVRLRVSAILLIWKEPVSIRLLPLASNADLIWMMGR